MRCASVLALLCLLSVSPSVLAAPLSPTASPPAAPGPSLPLPSDPSGTLSGASSELGQIADELESLLARLNRSLEAAGIYQDASARSLESSISSATTSIGSLVASEAALKTQARNQARELWIWRGTTAATIVVAILALVR